MTLDERLLSAVKEAIAAEQIKTFTAMEAKIRRLTKQRDQWKDIATRYRKNLLEKK